MTADGKHCPACGKDIGIWPVVSAALPNLIRCPHCRVRLTYDSIRWLIAGLILLGLVFGTGMAAMLVLLPVADLYLRAMIALFVLLLAWLPVEIAVAYYLRQTKVLRQPRVLSTKSSGR